MSTLLDKVKGIFTGEDATDSTNPNTPEQQRI